MADRRIELPTSSSIGTLIFLLWGLIGWGLQFTASYVGHTWLCAIGAPLGASHVLVAVLGVIAVVVILPVALVPGRVAPLARVRAEGADGRHLETIARVIAALSVVAAIWTAAAAFTLQACALGR